MGPYLPHPSGSSGADATSFETRRLVLRTHGAFPPVRRRLHLRIAELYLDLGENEAAQEQLAAAEELPVGVTGRSLRPAIEGEPFASRPELISLYVTKSRPDRRRQRIGTFFKIETGEHRIQPPGDNRRQRAG